MPIYTPNVPLANQTIAASQPIINANFQYLAGTAASGLLRDHNMTLDTSNTSDGTHKQVTFLQPLTEAPPITGAVSALYPKTVGGKPELFYYDGTTEFQMTFTGQIGAFALNGTISITGGATVNIPNLPNFSMGQCFFVRSGDSGWCVAEFMNVSGLTPRIQINGQNVGNKIFYQGNNLAIQNSDSTATYHYSIIYYITV